jgi:hypothetical protein
MTLARRFSVVTNYLAIELLATDLEIFHLRPKSVDCEIRVKLSLRNSVRI